MVKDVTSLLPVRLGDVGMKGCGKSIAVRRKLRSGKAAMSPSRFGSSPIEP